MSEFHETIRGFLEDLHLFLTVTLKTESVSSNCSEQKEALLIRLMGIGYEYPQLHLSNAVTTRPRRMSSSPQPYIDMSSTNAKNNNIFKDSYSIRNICNQSDYVYSDVPDDTEYEVVDPIAEKHNVLDTKTEVALEAFEDEKEVSPVAATELLNAKKCGYLEKKGKDRLAGFLTVSQKRWCAVKDGVFYYFDKPTDKRQKGQINLSGYEVCSLSDVTNRDIIIGGKVCFELVCPGRKTYQFYAVSLKDMKQWIAAIEECTGHHQQAVAPAPDATYFAEAVVVMSCDEDEDEIYESLEESLSSQTSHRVGSSADPLYDEGTSLTNNQDEDLYTDAESILTEVLQLSDKINENKIANVAELESSNEQVESDVQNNIVHVEGEGQVRNPDTWFVALWDCSSNSSNELEFKRGNLIRIVSKKYDDYSWWIGELGGQIGLVPRNYLVEAYERIA